MCKEKRLVKIEINEKTQVSVKETLFDYWKAKSKTMQKQQAPNPKKFENSKGNQEQNKKLKEYEERKLQIYKIFCGPQAADVKHTIDQNVNEEIGITSFIQKSQMELGAIAEEKPVPKQTLSKAVARRLYGQTIQGSKPLLVQGEPEQPFTVTFVEKLMSEFCAAKPDVKGYKNPELLFEFWSNLPDKAEKNLAYEEAEVSKQISLYFMGIAEFIDYEYKKAKGVLGSSCVFFSPCEDCVDKEDKLCEECIGKKERFKKNERRLFLFWKKDLGIEKRKMMRADFDVHNEKNLEEILSVYIKTTNAQNDSKVNLSRPFRSFENQKTIKKSDETGPLKNASAAGKKEEKGLDETQNMRQEGSRAKSAAERKREKENYLKNLAQPKDRLKQGKKLLELIALFPHDRILRKLILDEFKDTKLAKSAHEYFINDSDEEEVILHGPEKIIVEKEKKNKSKIEKEKKEKEKIISLQAIYTDLISRYKIEKKEKVTKSKEEIQKIEKEEQGLEKLMAEKAKEYKELRSRRQEELIPQEKEYLKGVYKQCYQKFPLIMKLKYDRTPAEAKKLEEKKQKENKKEGNSENKGEVEDVQDIPVAFKRYFYEVYRRLLAKPGVKNKFSQKAPFWIPPSNQSKRSQSLHSQLVSFPLDCFLCSMIWPFLFYEEQRV